METELMFKIECFCDDKRVGDILRSLSMLGVFDVKAVPVVNAVKTTNGKVVAATPGDLLDVFEKHLRDNDMEEVRPSDIIAFMPTVGRSKKSYSLLLTKAINAGILKKKKDDDGKNVYQYSRTK